MNISILILFFGCLVVVGCIGPDIRRRPSRPITGESACTPSWDGTGRVLDKAELQSFSSSPHKLRHQLSPEERSHRCACSARGREVNSRSEIHTARSGSRFSHPSHSLVIAFFLSSSFFPHRSHIITRHLSSRAFVASMNIRPSIMFLQVAHELHARSLVY